MTRLVPVVSATSFYHSHYRSISPCVLLTVFQKKRSPATQRLYCLPCQAFKKRCFGLQSCRTRVLKTPDAHSRVCDAKKTTSLAPNHKIQSCCFWTSLFWVSIKLARTSMSAHREFDSPLVRRFPPLHQARKTKSEPLSTGLVGD